MAVSINVGALECLSLGRKRLLLDIFVFYCIIFFIYCLSVYGYYQYAPPGPRMFQM